MKPHQESSYPMSTYYQSTPHFGSLADHFDPPGEFGYQGYLLTTPPQPQQQPQRQYHHLDPQQPQQQQQQQQPRVKSVSGGVGYQGGGSTRQVMVNPVAQPENAGIVSDPEGRYTGRGVPGMESGRPAPQPMLQQQPQQQQPKLSPTKPTMQQQQLQVTLQSQQPPSRPILQQQQPQQPQQHYNHFANFYGNTANVNAIPFQQLIPFLPQTSFNPQAPQPQALGLPSMSSQFTPQARLSFYPGSALDPYQHQHQRRQLEEVHQMNSLYSMTHPQPTPFFLDHFPRPVGEPQHFGFEVTETTPRPPLHQQVPSQADSGLDDGSHSDEEEDDKEDEEGEEDGSLPQRRVKPLAQKSGGAVPSRPKRRHRHPERWIKNVKKRERATNHQLGPNCHCKRFRCFDEKTTEEQRQELITVFNNLADYNKQQQFLGSLIEATSTPEESDETESDTKDAKEVKEGKKRHSYSSKYFIPVNDARIRVCQKAFCSFFGITTQRVNLLTSKVFKYGTGNAPMDLRGKHTNRGKRPPKIAFSSSPSPDSLQTPVKPEPGSPVAQLEHQDAHMPPQLNPVVTNSRPQQLEAPLPFPFSGLVGLFRTPGV